MASRKLTAQERKKYASAMRQAEREIHSQVAAYITAFEQGKDERFLAGVNLAEDARFDLGRGLLASCKRYVTDGVRLQ